MGSEHNLTLEELNKLERSNYLPLTILLVIIMLIGIVGNILVLIIYKRKFKRSSARCYILSLAIADLSVSIVGIPYHVLDLTLILTYTHTNVCKTFSFLIGACTLSSAFILLVVGLDRYFKVCRPLKRQIKDFGDRKACMLASFVAVIISIPNGVIYGESTVITRVDNLTGVECFISDIYEETELAVGYLGLTFLVFVISVTFLIIIYGLICKKIYHDKSSGTLTLKKGKSCGFCCTLHNREEIETDKTTSDAIDVGKITSDATRSARNNTLKFRTTLINKTDSTRNSCSMVRHVRPGSKAVEKNTMKITLMMLTITIVFVISYLPFIIISILDSTDEHFWANRSVTESVFLDFMLRLYLINNVTNPIIYSFWDKRFRKETKLIIHAAFCLKWKLDSEKHSNGRGYSRAHVCTSKGTSRSSGETHVKTNETTATV